VTFRLRRVAGGQRVTFAFSGALTTEELAEVTATTEREQSSRIAFDLADLTMVSREGVAYLRRAEAAGIELVNCPRYIRRWIGAEEAG
jgi:ABC-type transporter Mla MlaB component